MRLDLVLKLSGIIKRRTIAKEIIEKGNVEINGRTGKPSSDVKENDHLLIHIGRKNIEVVISFITKGKKEYPTFEQISSFYDEVNEA